MARRVILDSTAASPFRVSVTGVDAATATFGNLIFDANQMPLRLSQNGYMTIGVISDAAYQAPSPQNIAEATGPTVIVPAPSGCNPIFMVMLRSPFQVDQGTGSPIAYAGEVITPAAMNSHISGLSLAQPYFAGLSSGVAGFKGAGGAICNNTFIGVTYTPATHNTAYGGFNQFSVCYINYAIYKNYA
jgi:hypothetical protein